MVWRFMLIVLLLSLVLSTLTHRSVLPLRVHAVLSGSMGSSVPRGSIIFSKQVEEYRIGDVITFPYPANERESITHRVVRVVGSKPAQRLETKGDANPNGDGWTIPQDRVYGRVSLVIPGLGWGVLGLQTPLGYLCFAFGTLVLFVLPLLRRALRELRVLG